MAMPRPEKPVPITTVWNSMPSYLTASRLLPVEFLRGSHEGTQKADAAR
jgi:hypothetical protein